MWAPYWNSSRFVQTDSTEHGTERRGHPRIRIPLVVEVAHKSFGKQTTTVRDLSQNGMFVELPEPALRRGARIKLSQIRLSTVDQHATPTVDAVVRRVEPDGLSVEFDSKVGAHLWNTVERTREELAVGQDLFQIHQSVAVFDYRGWLLIAQTQGRWGLPGTYLRVEDDPNELLKEYFLKTFNLHIEPGRLIDQNIESNPKAREASVFRLVRAASADDHETRLLPGQGYKQLRWLSSERGADEVQFASPFDRNIVRRVFRERKGSID